MITKTKHYFLQVIFNFGDYVIRGLFFGYYVSGDFDSGILSGHRLYIKIDIFIKFDGTEYLLNTQNTS